MLRVVGSNPADPTILGRRALPYLVNLLSIESNRESKRVGCPRLCGSVSLCVSNTRKNEC